MRTTISDIQSFLIKNKDIAYRDFHSRLVPTLDKETIIGVRIPVIRKYAKQLLRCGQTEMFLKDLPHKYYEENNLHAFIIEQISDFDECVCALDEFLPFVDNWATCDSLRPKCFNGMDKALCDKAFEWIDCEKTFVKRFGIGVLMNHFLDDKFDCKYLEKISKIRSSEYYVNMMIAWYFATSLAKQYEHTVVYLEEHKLDKWTHNKTIQKAIESFRITQSQKAYLKTLRV